MFELPNILILFFAVAALLFVLLLSLGVPKYRYDSSPLLAYTTPHATLDYAFDWTEWLQTNETINSYVLTVDAGITKESDTENAGIVTVWLSSGTLGTTYNIACRITSSLGRTDERTVEIIMVDR
jgi:hypothetical protein